MIFLSVVSHTKSLFNNQLIACKSRPCPGDSIHLSERLLEELMNIPWPARGQIAAALKDFPWQDISSESLLKTFLQFTGHYSKSSSGSPSEIAADLYRRDLSESRSTLWKLLEAHYSMEMISGPPSEGEIWEYNAGPLFFWWQRSQITLP